ncbi:hypothetical protein DYB32_008718 [Aphanomyces invadans]|uniref:PDZ domain-containing protein n=1 Tax=Aphanomyces invadans TaxID=157072 RepID=A0A418AK84_9STRA|nr:hypothetical protein DYB32_008718 [Aphanomyces invadans]
MSSRHRGGYDDDDDDDMLMKALLMSEPYDSSDESYDDESGDSSDEDIRPPPPVSKGKASSTANGKGGAAMKKKESSGSSSRIRVDSDMDRRIEEKMEKVIRRLKKQEENRIAQAIEAQMAQANANWTDADMNRIAMEVKNRLQKEMGHMFMAGSSSRSRKNSITRESLLQSRQITSIAEETQQPSNGSSRGGDLPQGSLSRSNSSRQTLGQEISRPAPSLRSNLSRDTAPAPQQQLQPEVSAPTSMPLTNSRDNLTSSTRNIVVDAAPVLENGASSRIFHADAAAVGPPPAWNNKCAAFLSLKIVVWKLEFLPQLKFGRNDVDGSWNKVIEVDADESFSHVEVGDLLMSLNGQHVAGLATDDGMIQEMLQMTHGSHLILKFSTTKPLNNPVKEYSVRWGNGPLGLTLKDDGSPEALPIVHRLTRKPGSVALKENIAIGDVLCAINNIDTVQLGCALTMSVLKKVQLPATLTFRGVGGNHGSSSGGPDAVPAPGGVQVSREVVRVPSSKNIGVPSVPPVLSPTPGAVYTVNWTVGPLGLTIIPGLAAGELPVIKRVTGKGESPGIENAQVGDFLLAVNSQSVASLGFETIVEMMKSLPKPIFLEFRSAQKSNHVHSSRGDKPERSRADRPMRNLPSPAPEVPVVAPPPPPAPTDCVRSNQSAVTSSVRSSPPPSSKWLQQTNGEEVDIDVPPAPASTYSVVWGADGPLGLTIDAIPHATGAFIKRSNHTGAAAHLPEDCVGDEMTHINDIDVTQMDYSRIVTYLRKVPRPVTLRFKKDSIVGRDSVSNAPGIQTQTTRLSASTGAPVMRSASANSIQTPGNQYDLSWTDGSLGLSLHAADDKSEYPYITRVTGVGCAAHLPSTVVGDQLRYINSSSCHSSGMTFNDVMEMLKTLPKPIHLRFQKTDEKPLAPRSHSGNGTYPPVNHSTTLSSNHSTLLSNGTTLHPANGSFNSGGDDDSTAHNMLTPFAGAPKLSTGRRQKIVKQLKK